MRGNMAKKEGIEKEISFFVFVCMREGREREKIWNIMTIAKG
jgi:hypothetical protein